MRNRSVGSRLVLSAQWSSDLFLWGRREGPWPGPAVRPVAGRNSNAEASNVPHFQSRSQSLSVLLTRRYRSFGTGKKSGLAQGFGSEAPHLKPLGMLLPIGNRKVETCRDRAVLDCVTVADNLLLTINLLNAPESPDACGDLSGLIWGACPLCSILRGPADIPGSLCEFFQPSFWL